MKADEENTSSDSGWCFESTFRMERSLAPIKPPPTSRESFDAWLERTRKAIAATDERARRLARRDEETP